jgi:peptidoglycan/LPS O-acetylase OafA/YrhL
MHQQNRIFGLDLMRAVAILLVLKGHAKLLAGDLFSHWPSFSTIDGVELFFVLSGFLIGGIILKSLDELAQWNFKSILHFWKRRWYRTLPNYYLILLLQILIVALGWSNDTLDGVDAHFFFFTQNLFSGFQGFFWESWSLSVEEWFYLLFPFVLWLLSRLFNKSTAFLAASFTLLFTPLFLRWVLLSDVTLDWYSWDVQCRKVVAFRLDAIAFGLLAVYVSRFFKAAFSQWAKPLFVLGIGLLLLDAQCMNDPNGIYEKFFSFSIKPLAVSMLIPLLYQWQTRPMVWWAKAVEWTSKISYSMYLLNLGVVYTLLNHFFHPVSTAGWFFRYLLFWLITFAASHLLYHYHERFWLKLRDERIQD